MFKRHLSSRLDELSTPNSDVCESANSSLVGPRRQYRERQRAVDGDSETLSREDVALTITEFEVWCVHV